MAEYQPIADEFHRIVVEGQPETGISASRISRLDRVGGVVTINQSVTEPERFVASFAIVVNGIWEIPESASFETYENAEAWACRRLTERKSN